MVFCPLFLLTKQTFGYINSDMDRQKTVSRSVHIDFCPDEDKALTEYLDHNGIKFKSLVRMLVLKELECKSVINSAEYTPPKVTELLIKSKR